MNALTLAALSGAALYLGYRFYGRFITDRLYGAGDLPDEEIPSRAREDGVDFVPTYGNTLMGLAIAKPYDPADNYAIIYYPPLPRAVFEIVDPDNLDEMVPYGATGRVLLTTLTKEFFMPRFPERDEGERAAPCREHPWDGVSNLRLLSSLKTSVVVGVY